MKGTQCFATSAPSEGLERLLFYYDFCNMII
jgi:hypothetical protein